MPLTWNMMEIAQTIHQLRNLREIRNACRALLWNKHIDTRLIGVFRHFTRLCFIVALVVSPRPGRAPLLSDV